MRAIEEMWITTPDLRSIMPGMKMRSSRDGRHQVEFKDLLPIFVRETLSEPAGFGFSSAHIIDKNVEPAPFLANAIGHRVYAGSGAKIRLHRKEIGTLVME